MSYYEIRAELAILSDTIRNAFNRIADPDDFAEVARQKQCKIHRFCGLRVVRIQYIYNTPDCIHNDPDCSYATSVVTLNGIDINASPVSKDEFFRYKNPIKEIMKFYKCNTIYIEFDLGKPNKVLFDIDGILFAPNELTPAFTKEMVHPIRVDDIDSLFCPSSPENMAEFLVDCLRLDPIIGSYMPYKEKIND